MKYILLVHHDEEVFGKFSEAPRQQMLEESMQPGTCRFVARSVAFKAIVDFRLPERLSDVSTRESISAYNQNG